MTKNQCCQPNISKKPRFCKIFRKSRVLHNCDSIPETSYCFKTKEIAEKLTQFFRTVGNTVWVATLVIHLWTWKTLPLPRTKPKLLAFDSVINITPLKKYHFYCQVSYTFFFKLLFFKYFFFLIFFFLFFQKIIYKVIYYCNKFHSLIL